MPLLAASLAMMTFDGRDVTVTVDGRLLDVIVPKFTRSQSRDVIESSTLHSDDNQTGPNAFRLVRRTWQSRVDGHEMTSVHWTGSAKRP